MIARTIPSQTPESKIFESQLKRTARKGVVQLFNAVREYQKQSEKRFKRGNIQQRTNKIEETKQSFESLLKVGWKGHFLSN